MYPHFKQVIRMVRPCSGSTFPECGLIFSWRRAVKANRLNRQLSGRLTLDFFMVCLFFVAMAYPVTDNLVHEIVGAALIILIVTHNAINRRWYKSLFKGEYSLARIVHTATNLLLAFLMICMLASASSISHTLFALVPFELDKAGKQLHIFGAYWGIIILSVHIGIHWQMLMSIVKSRVNINLSGAWLTVFSRVAAVLLSAYGIYASFNRQVASKLFLESIYDFWDSENSPIWLFLDYFSIMALYITLTHYLFKFIRRIDKHKSSQHRPE